jgi:hypothetical protein
MIIEVIDLPRSCWRIVPPGRGRVVLTLAGVILTALAFGLFG